MTLDDLKGLKYFIIFGTIVLGAFIYSGTIGWKWVNFTKTQKEKTTGQRGTRGTYYRYHK